MRPLSDAFQNLLYTGWRQPAYKLLAWDPTIDTMSAVVTETYTQTPFDLTPYATQVQWTPEKLDFVLFDPQQIFHPDTGSARQYLQDSAIIRLVEGDARLNEADWTNTFTGYIKGQIGWENCRSKQVLEAKVTVFSRDNSQSLKRRLITTQAYSVGTDIGAMLYDVATRYIGMSQDEIRVPLGLGLQLKHQVTQLCQEAPWDGISTILEAVGQVPFFDGDGRLAAWPKSMRRAPNRILTDGKFILDDQIPAYTQDNINYIRVNFLDSQLTCVQGPYQKLGQASITTGFFTNQEKIKCWWSKDHTQQASGTNLIIIKSVNANLLPVGKESYRAIDSFHGEITIDISAWVPVLATAMALEYLAAAAIPDHVPPGQGVQTDVFSGTGITITPTLTIPWGKLLQAQASLAMMLIMMSLGSAQYEIWGTPFNYAYLMQHSDAIESTMVGAVPQPLPYYQQNMRQIENDLVGTFDQADNIALIELIWEKSKSYPRNLIIEDDPALELGDIVQIADGRKFMIQDMKKTLKRGEVPVLEIDCIKVMTA
ncbi:MAG: hypothetical protein ACLPT6_12095 [Desulfobaccales bacterium]